METSRLQLALNVSDLDAASAFYSKLFGTEPAKRRNGYVNFEIANPPLKLVLFEQPEATSALNHLGVEVPTTADVTEAAQRFQAAGLTHRAAETGTCCHAVQDKVWVSAPDVPLGAWEFYTVLADAPDQLEDDGGCCTPEPGGEVCCSDTAASQ